MVTLTGARKLALAALAASAISAGARAEVCDPALVVSTYKKFSSSDYSSALASFVSEEAYNEARHNAGGDANATIYGIPMGASYSEFQSNISSHSAVSSSSSNLTSNQRENMIWSGLDSSSTSAYAKCLDSQVLMYPGLHMAAAYATSEDITVVIRWNAVGNQGALRPLEWQWNGKPPVITRRGHKTAGFPDQILPGTYYLTVPRPSRQMQLSLNSNGQGASVVMTPLPRVIHHPRLFAKVIEAKDFDHGRSGYMIFDPSSGMMLSASPGGGPSENFSVDVTVPRDGTYVVDAMWASAVPTEVYLYTSEYTKDCTDPNMNMNDASVHYLPPPTGGWGAANLARYPDRVSQALLLSAGSHHLIFTTRACGHGMGGGRMPSTKWIKISER